MGVKNWVDLFQGRDRWRALFNVAMDHSVP
jgi:hypothetical protein